MKAFVPGLHETVYCWQKFVLEDEKELIKVGIKMIQKADKLNNKERLIYIMDTIYQIISKQRKVLRDINNQEVLEAKCESKKKIRHLIKLVSFRKLCKSHNSQD